MKKNLKGIEMWFYRSILRIPWRKHESNVEVLRENGKAKDAFVLDQEKLILTGYINDRWQQQVLYLKY